MKVKELRRRLRAFHPEAEVLTIVKGRTYSFSVTYGDKEGETKKKAKRVGIYVEGFNQQEVTNDAVAKYKTKHSHNVPRGSNGNPQGGEEAKMDTEDS